MRTLIIIVSMFVFSSCSNYDFKITELKHEKLNFVELPVAVKEFLIQPPEFDNENPSPLMIINPQETNRYVSEVIFNKWVSSWVDYVKLIDTKNKISYKINQGVPDPYILFDNRLYIPDRFNILTTVDDMNKVEFTCYILK